MYQTEGPGWLLARDSGRELFPVMIGGDGWAIEIREDEWTVLASLILDLMKQHESLENQLMPEEALCLEMERQPWWACLDGDRDSWSLKLVLKGNNSSHRGAEMEWPIPAAQGIALAMRNMWDSC